MSAHVLHVLNLLNEIWNRDKMRGCAKHFIALKINNTGARLSDNDRMNE